MQSGKEEDGISVFLWNNMIKFSVVLREKFWILNSEFNVKETKTLQLIFALIKA